MSGITIFTPNKEHYNKMNNWLKFCQNERKKLQKYKDKKKKRNKINLYHLHLHHYL